MKAKELAELLLEHPDYDVEICVADTSNCNYDSGCLYPEYRRFKVIGIEDVRSIDKGIDLDLYEI